MACISSEKINDIVLRDSYFVLVKIGRSWPNWTPCSVYLVVLVVVFELDLYGANTSVITPSLSRINRLASLSVK